MPMSDYPDVMMLEADAILRKAVTYGNICRALVEIGEDGAFMRAGENFLEAAREFSKQIRIMKQFAAATRTKELAAAIAENDAAGRTQ